MMAQDLFPGIDCPEASHDELSYAIQYVTTENGYLSLSEQVNICNIRKVSLKSLNTIP